MLAQQSFINNSDGFASAKSNGIGLSVSVLAEQENDRRRLSRVADNLGCELVGSNTLSGHRDRSKALGNAIFLRVKKAELLRFEELCALDTFCARTARAVLCHVDEECVDEAFCAFAKSGAAILVNPNRGDYLVACSQLLLSSRVMGVREGPEQGDLILLRLQEQIGEIAARLDVLTSPEGSDPDSAFRFGSPQPGFNGPEQEQSEEKRLMRAPRPALPDPRLVRRIIRQRQMRARFFDGELFADPAWDILLDLTAARAEHTRVSVTSLCIASGVPPTTALRWIGQMTDAGLLQRVEDETDRRRAFIALSDKAADAMARYFAELGKEAAQLI